MPCPAWHGSMWRGGKDSETGKDGIPVAIVRDGSDPIAVRRSPRVIRNFHALGRRAYTAATGASRRALLIRFNAILAVPRHTLMSAPSTSGNDQGLEHS